MTTTRRDLNDAFAEIFQVAHPYGRYQTAPAEYLLAGKNVILQAPTGSGKTKAALFPYLLARKNNLDFPRKMLYSVPMRVLAQSFHDDLLKERKQNDMDIRLQTGEQQGDPRFEGEVTFATIDQVLSSFLSSPYSLPRRLSNLNIGAVTSSYLVFDEFHLFEPTSTLPTTLEMLRMMRGIAPFLLMTATFSTDMLAGLAKALDAVIIPEDDLTRREMQTIPPQQKTRRYYLEGKPLCAEEVLEKHKTRTLVVCNVVDRAQALYERIQERVGQSETRVLLLHSRFLPCDRQRIEAQIRSLFGKSGDHSGSWIVVATQVIEVGLDITCQTLHTELAPANAVLQRAGRCARYQDEKGDVFIYSNALDGRGDPISLEEKAAPYREQLEEIRCTRIAFAAHNGSILTFGDEQEIISAAHGPSDKMAVEGLKAGSEMHRLKMNSVMDGQRSAQAGDLVRAISSQLVVVHDVPQVLLERPFDAESFSLHPGTVRKLVKEWIDRGEDLDLEGGNGVYALHDKGDIDESGRSAYCWVPINRSNIGDVSGAALILVNPLLAGYDSELGFVPDRSTGYRAGLTSLPVASKVASYGYRLETYAEHVWRSYQAFLCHVWPAMAAAATSVEKVCGWTPGIVERTAHLVVLLHDVGKLGQGWQKWVERYQQAIGQPAPLGFYAHTDNDPTNPLHRQKQEEMGRKPAHAAEGAVAVAPLLVAVTEETISLFTAAFTAIARHHGAFTRDHHGHTLVHGADRAIAETLVWLPQSWVSQIDPGRLLVKENAQTIDNLLVNPACNGEYLAYTLLARALRLADQAGTAEGGKTG